MISHINDLTMTLSLIFNNIVFYRTKPKPNELYYTLSKQGTYTKLNRYRPQTKIITLAASKTLFYHNTYFSQLSNRTLRSSKLTTPSPPPQAGEISAEGTPGTPIHWSPRYVKSIRLVIPSLLMSGLTSSCSV